MSAGLVIVVVIAVVAWTATYVVLGWAFRGRRKILRSVAGVVVALIAIYYVLVRSIVA